MRDYFLRETTIENNRELIEENLKLLYRFPKYIYISKILEHQELRRTLLKVFNYAKNSDIYSYHGKITFTLSSRYLTKLRDRTTTSTSNKYLNFLCAAKLINKHTIENTFQLKMALDLYNKEKEKNKKASIINAFYVYRYNEKSLKIIDNQCKLLLDHGITPGNISKDKLIISGLEELADRVYQQNIKDTITWKDNSFSLIEKFINQQIELKGFCSKQEIYDNVIINKNYNKASIDKILKIYSFLLLDYFKYKKPTNEEKKIYGLTSNKFIYLEHSRTVI